MHPFSVVQWQGDTSSIVSAELTYRIKIFWRPWRTPRLAQHRASSFGRFFRVPINFKAEAEFRALVVHLKAQCVFFVG
jgi:hypothetical protein